VHLLNADLHSHSTSSDGSLTPEAVARRAHANGVDLWALTDHDDISGIPAARATAATLGMAYVTGVEVSVSFAGETVHILGFGFDDSNPALQAGLHQVRSGRRERARAMGESLAHAGIPGAYEGACALAPNPELVSRTHFARFLVEQGHCANVHEVFTRYLKEGKPGFVTHQWARLGEALGWIHGAGGVTSIAHPARYPFTPTVEYALFSEFKAHGGSGVEVVCGSHSVADAQRVTGLALEFGLMASRGSDFHSPTESRIDLGQLPDLPGALTPIWSDWPAARETCASASLMD
jgi:3',5'-nucleoside bisphosphate phosphatase